MSSVLLHVTGGGHPEPTQTARLDTGDKIKIVTDGPSPLRPARSHAPWYLEEF